MTRKDAALFTSFKPTQISVRKWNLFVGSHFSNSMWNKQKYAQRRQTHAHAMLTGYARFFLQMVVQNIRLFPLWSYSNKSFFGVCIGRIRPKIKTSKFYYRISEMLIQIVCIFFFWCCEWCINCNLVLSNRRNAMFAQTLIRCCGISLCWCFLLFSSNIFCVLPYRIWGLIRTIYDCYVMILHWSAVHWLYTQRHGATARNHFI